MIIYAKQIDPEYQESPLSRDNYTLADCAIFGNPRYYSHGLDCLEAIPADQLDEIGMEPDGLAAALTRCTGHPWKAGCIRGSCQGEWQHILYRSDIWSAAAVQAIECEYFNLGTEWICTDDPDGSDEISVYCYGWRLEDIADEIRGAFGATAADRVELHTFDGYTRTPKYREVTL